MYKIVILLREMNILDIYVKKCRKFHLVVENITSMVAKYLFVFFTKFKLELKRKVF
jgi:hypothetical protein